MRLARLTIFAVGLGLSLGLPALPLSAQNSSRGSSRLLSAIADDGAQTAIGDTVVPQARLAKDLGPAPGDTPLQSLTLRFNLTDAQSAALTKLLADQQNPASPSYRQWLSPEQYAARFGLPSSDLAAVSAWLQRQGFTVTGLAHSRSFITFSGTAADVQHAFGTTLHTVSLGGEQHIANLSDPVLPAGMAGLVSGITGLNDFHLKPHARTHTAPAPDPKFTSAVSGNHFIAPGDFYTIYDLNPLLGNAIDGTGVTIAIMGQTDISLADTAAFRSAAGLPAKQPATKLFGPDPGTTTLDIEEAQLDVEWSGAVAPNASILYVFSTDVIGTSLTQTVDNNLAPIISISYGNCESGFGASDIGVFNQLFRQANAQGQTVVVPSGDSGATDCDYQVPTATQGLAVDFPGSSPFVTSVGGSMFNENGAAFFSTTNGSTAGSALSYIPEAVWNESIAGAGLGSGGGGVSNFFTKPDYQFGAGVPNDFSRDVPDLSLNAASAHDGYLFCAKGACVTGFRSAAGNLDVVGGTSVSTPAFAAILALLEQKIQTRVGNANPTIYGLANSSFYTSVFHDITVGNNNSPCAAGSLDCPASGTVGYPATPGYDLATGWGSVDAFNLVSDWLLVAPASVSGGAAGTLGQNSSSTTLTASPTSVSAGAASVLTATVRSSSIGLQTIPSGTVQFLVDTAPVGSPVPLINGSASLSVPTASLSSGAHLLAASYTGDPTFAGSKGSVRLDVVSATSPDFVLTPTTSSVTANSGQAAPGVTFTVTSVNGFTGNVTFAGVVTSGTGALTGLFSVNPVVLAASASGSTVLTLDAFTSANQPSGGVIKALPSGHASLPALPQRLPWQLAGSGFAMAGLFLLILPRGKNRWPALLIALLSVSTLGFAGCSSGSAPFGSSGTPPPTITRANPGIYTITVSATGINAAGTPESHRAVVTLTVQ